MAGTLTTTTSDLGGGYTKYSLAWVSDASGNVTTNTFSVKRGLISQVKFIPDGGGTQPTDLYDMTIVDSDGVDILAGGGVNLSNSTATIGGPVELVQSGTLTPAISNAGNAKGGTVVLIIGPSAAAATSAGAAGSGITTSGTQRVTLATDDLAFTGSKVGVRQRFVNVAFTTLTRPTNTTPYAANDSISDSGTAGSVTALSATTASDTNDDPICISEIMVDTNDTALGNGISIRAFLFRADPTASSGVGAGDNVAYSNKRNGYIGSFSGVFRPFSDGGGARLVPDEGSFVIANPSASGTTVWIQYQTLGAFTPSANSTTLAGRIKGFQGRA
jgi:hypothetical protein